MRAPASGLAVLVASALAWAAPAPAHQFAPALLELEEVSPGQAEVSWKQPVVKVQGSQLRPVLPVECKGVGDPTITHEGTGARARWRIECPSGLAGKTVGVEGIASSRADVLLRVALLDGRKLRQVLTAEEPSFEIDGGIGGGASRLGVLESYTVLGVEHILSGWDHLLFVLALVLLIGWGRHLLWTVTAFTLGHSATLALASLGLVKIPQAPIEAAIALSIYFLAVELTVVASGGMSFTRSAPWLVTSGFGLLHGLGFAGALAEVGLPASEIPLALFSFNVGIEVGQLAFVCLVLVVIVALKALPVRSPKWVGLVPAYGIGALAVFWFFERVAGIVAS